jgi:tartrate dehydratase alpha subunit/fumarate hydratase class I-like protein
MTTTIKYSDLVESIAAALQYISYYHPADYIAHRAVPTGRRAGRSSELVVPWWR